MNRVDVQRKEHMAEHVAEHVAEYDAGDHPMPAPSPVRMEADLVNLQSMDLERRMDPGERQAHVRAAGGNPESIDAAVRESGTGSPWTTWRGRWGIGTATSGRCTRIGKRCA